MSFAPQTSSRIELDDSALLVHVDELVKQSSALTAELVVHLAEVEERRLHLELGYADMFRFCTEHLHLAEGAAYKRMAAAQLARSYPLVRRMLAANEVHLTALGLLRRYLNEENHVELLTAARHKSKRQVEQIIAERFPKGDVPDSVRKLPSRSTRELVSALGDSGSAKQQAGGSAEGALPVKSEEHAVSVPQRSTPKAVVQPLAPERYRVQFTASKRFHDKLRMAQALLGHQVLQGELEVVLEKALDVLLEQRMKRKLGLRQRERRAVLEGIEGKASASSTSTSTFTSTESGTAAATATAAAAAADADADADADAGTGAGTGAGAGAGAGTGKRSRHVPASVLRTLFSRDGLQCSFISKTGHRCQQHSRLEAEHFLPFARGGKHDPESMGWMCRSHNLYRAEQEYGRTFIRQRIARAQAHRQDQPRAHLFSPEKDQHQR